MRWIFLLVLPGCLMGKLESSIGNGDVTTETRTVDPWSTLQVDNGISVVVDAAPAGEVSVRTDSNLIDAIETTVENGSLTVKVEDGVILSLVTELVVTVDSDQLSSVTASGGSSVQAPIAKGDAAQLVANGGSTIEATGLEVETLDAVVTGGSVMMVEGKGTSLQLNLSGGSTAEAAPFATERADVFASGGASAEITATEQVTGNLSGGSTLVVNGGANTDAVTISGGSDLVSR